MFFYFSQIDTPFSLFLSVLMLSFTLLISLPLRVLFAHATYRALTPPPARHNRFKSRQSHPSTHSHSIPSLIHCSSSPYFVGRCVSKASMHLYQPRTTSASLLCSRRATTCRLSQSFTPTRHPDHLAFLYASSKYPPPIWTWSARWLTDEDEKAVER